MKVRLAALILLSGALAADCRPLPESAAATSQLTALASDPLSGASFDGREQVVHEVAEVARGTWFSEAASLRLEVEHIFGHDDYQSATSVRGGLVAGF